jgi:hypothetical protein
MSRRTKPAKDGGVVEVTTHNSMMTVDGKRRKRWCIGCGGPRDPEFAERIACFCCGSLGTRKTQPLFDENGDAIEGPAEVEPVEKPKRERKPRKVAAPDSAGATENDAAKAVKLSRQKPVITEARPTERPTRIRSRGPSIQVLPKPKETTQTAAGSLAALFL